MRQNLVLVLVGLVLLFAVITISRPMPSGGANNGELETATAEKERIRRFWSLHRQAGIHRTSGNFKLAIQLYEEALAIDGQHEDALYYLSNAYLEVGRLLDAELALERLVRVHPTSSRGHSRHGDIHLCFPDESFFDPDLAEASFRQAVDVNKEETGPLIRLAQVALVEERLDDALQLLETIIGTNAASIESQYLLGYIAWKKGNARSADGLFTRALASAHGQIQTEPVVGEGDRKTGSAIKPGEQLTCPAMLNLLSDISSSTGDAQRNPDMQASYETMNRKLAELRILRELRK